MPDYGTVPHPLRWWWLAGALVGVVAVGVGLTALSPGYPRVAVDLSVSVDTVQWIAGAAGLGLALLVVPGAVLGDLLGHARVYAVGAIGFVLASALGAVAGDGGTLIAARLGQGVAAGLILPQVIGYARTQLPRVERAVACGLFGLAFVAGAAVGPALGAWLAESSGWRAVFWTLVVTGGLGLVPAVPSMFARHLVRLDPWALLVAAVAVPAAAGIMLPLTARDLADWPMWYVLPLAAGCLLLAGCAGVEIVRRGAVHGLGAGLVLLLAVAAAAPHLTAVQVYAQVVGGFSADSIWFALLPAAVGALVGAAVAVVLAVTAYTRLAAPIGAVVIAAGGVAHLVTLDAAAATEGVLAFGAVTTGLGLALVVAGLLHWDISDRPAPAPAVVFAALALGTPAGGLLYQLLVPNSLVLEGDIEGLHDATIVVLIVTIGMLVVAAAIALALAFAGQRRRTDVAVDDHGKLNDASATLRFP